MGQWGRIDNRLVGAHTEGDEVKRHLHLERRREVRQKAVIRRTCTI